MQINRIIENDREVSLAETAQGLWAYGDNHFQAISNLLGIIAIKFKLL